MQFLILIDLPPFSIAERLGRRGRLSRNVRLNVIVQLALSNRPGCGERGVAFHIDFGQRELCLSLRDLPASLRELSFRLIETGLEWPWIDFEQYLVLVDKGAFNIVLFDEISRNLRLDIGIDVAVKCCHPVAIYRNILLYDFDNPDVCRRRGIRRAGGLRRTTAQNRDYQG